MLGLPSPARLAVLLLALGCSREPAARFDPGAECPAILADTTLPTTAQDAETQRAAGRQWSDRETRTVYLCRVRAIAVADPEWRAAGLGAEARARRAYDTRHAARLTARAMMQSRATVAALRTRDYTEYGDPDGPTWAWLVERGREKGLTGEALYESIVAGAAETNDTVDGHFGL